MEDWLNVRLFERGRHGIQLTPPGQAYFTSARAALDQIEHGTRQLQQSPDERRLRIKLPPTFAIRWLMPRLAGFHALHPEIDVQITTSHQRADFEREEVDVSIHSEPTPPEGPGYRRLFGETLVPVCAPGLLERGPPLKTADDLAQHVLLCSMNRPSDWPAWLAAAGARGVDGNSGLKFENAALAYQAAADRLGVIVAQLPFVRDDLRTGRLVAPFALRVPTAGAYYLACKRRGTSRAQAGAGFRRMDRGGGAGGERIAIARPSGRDGRRDFAGNCTILLMQKADVISPKPVMVPGPDHPITIEPNPARVVVTVNGRVIADSVHALTLREAKYPPVQYIPREDVAMSLLHRSDHATYCPYKGDCAYYSIPCGGERSVNAVWTSRCPIRQWRPSRTTWPSTPIGSIRSNSVRRIDSNSSGQPRRPGATRLAPQTTSRLSQARRRKRRPR